MSYSDRNGSENNNPNSTASLKDVVSTKEPRKHPQVVIPYKPQPEGISTYLSTKEKSAIDLSLQLRAAGKIKTIGPLFKESDRSEINNLIGQDVIEFIRNPRDSRVRIFNARMVRDVKGIRTNKFYEKSRLVIQGFNNSEKKEILTQSPTI